MENALKRFFEAAGCRTQMELAQFLDIQQSTVSDAKKRGTIPSEWLVKLLHIKHVNPDWVLTGEGSRYLVPADKKPILEKESLDDYPCQSLVNELVERAMEDLEKTPPA